MDQVEEAQSSNRELERERASWRNGVAIVEAATGIRLGPMARTRLSREERGQLVELSAKVARGGDVDVSRLNRKEEPMWEALVERASRRPGWFEREREDKETRHLAREMSKIATDLRKPRRRIDLHEPGSVTIPRLWAHDWFAPPDPVLWVTHLGVLVYLWGMFETAECLFRGGRFDTDDDGELVLYIDRRLGLGTQFDDDDQRLVWKDRLQHLVANDFFTMERSGGYWKVKLGSRLLRQIRREAA